MHDDSSRILYHYTDAGGLEGILQSLSLWATEAQFLNDAMEMRYGRSQVAEALWAQSKELDDGVPDSADASRAQVLQMVAAEIDEADLLGLTDAVAHVACFCEEGDLLSQWRGYAKTGGYAIGFRRSRLAELMDHVALEYKPPAPSVLPGIWAPRLLPVTYGQEAVREMVARVLAELGGVTPTAHPSPIAAMWVEHVVLPELAGVKDGAFEEEREWRLMFMTDRRSTLLNFRTGPLGIIPYVLVPFPPDAVAEIVIGPGNHKHLRERGVKRLLASMELETEVAVCHSRVPFRG